MAKIRKWFRFYGEVQGVGFRYHAQYGASLYGLTGWVKNNWDGSVEMQAQGSEESVDLLLQDLMQDRYIVIDRYETKALPPVEEERGFHVRYGG